MSPPWLVSSRRTFLLERAAYFARLAAVWTPNSVRAINSARAELAAWHAARTQP